MKSRKGYTLIELLVVAAIIAVMASIFVGADLPRKKLALQREAYFLAQRLRTIQLASSAIQGTDVCRIPVPQKSINEPEEGYAPFGGYAILFEKENPEYYIFANCSSILTTDKKRFSSTAIMNSLGVNDIFQVGYIEGGGGSTTVDEKLETINMQERADGVTVTNITATRNDNGQIEECESIVIGYEPPAPVPYIFCKSGGSYYFGVNADTSPYSEAEITLASEAGSRRIKVNSAGMISTTKEQ